MYEEKNKHFTTENSDLELQFQKFQLYDTLNWLQKNIYSSM